MTDKKLPQHYQKKRLVARSRKIEDEFLKRLMDRPAKHVCKDVDMPSFNTFWRWMQKDADLRERYRQVNEGKAALADAKITELQEQVREVVQEARAGLITKDVAYVAIQAARLDIDTEKWRAAKYYPRVYGTDQKVEVEHKHSLVDDLRVVQERIAERESKTINGTVQDVTVEDDE